jgi:hypothetical protein
MGDRVTGHRQQPEPGIADYLADPNTPFLDRLAFTTIGSFLVLTPGLNILTFGGTAAACGEETKLYHSPPSLPPAAPSTGGTPSQITPNDYYAVDENPSQRLDLALGDCLGPVAQLASSVEAICPRVLEARTCDDVTEEDCVPLEVGDCDPAFLDPIERSALGLAAKVEENAGVSLWDILSGSGSIPVTAMVTSHQFVTGTEELEESVKHVRYGSISITFGDYRAQIETHRQSTDHPQWFFPRDHIRCSFSEITIDEMSEYYGNTFLAWIPGAPVDFEPWDRSTPDGIVPLDGVKLEYRKNYNSPLQISVFTFEMNYYLESSVGSYRFPTTTLDVSSHFTEMTHYVSITNYALQTFVDEGLQRADELSGSAEFPHNRSKTLFWNIDWAVADD